MRIEDLLSDEVEEPNTTYKLKEKNQQAASRPPRMTDVTPATATKLVLQIEETHQTQTYLSQSPCIASAVTDQSPPKRKRMSSGKQQESNQLANVDIAAIHIF